MASVPDSNGWPSEIPNRPFVPAIRAVDIRVGDWIRHGQFYPKPEKFYLVAGIDAGENHVSIRFVLQPTVKLVDQPRVVTIRSYWLVEVRLLWPATVRLSTQATTLEIGTGITRTESAGPARVLDWLKQHTTNKTGDWND